MNQAASSQAVPLREWLVDRRLLHVNVDEFPVVADLVGLDGVVLTGKNSESVAMQLRRSGTALTVLVEAVPSSAAFASVENPFVLPEADSMFPMTLETYVAERLAAGDPYVLSPTGYVAANDPASLKAVVLRANKVSTDRMLLVLPIDGAWLKESHRRQLIAVIRRSEHPVALVLGATQNPLDVGRSSGLVEVLRELPDVSLLRADHLSGVEAAARSNGMVAVGLIPSRRRITPPQKQGNSYFRHDRRPQLYGPGVHRILAAATRDEWYANTPAPTCSVCCGGRSFDGFDDSAGDKLLGARHNATCLLGLMTSMRGSLAQRVERLANLYETSVGGHEAQSKAMRRQLRVPPEQVRLGAIAISERDANVRTSAP